MPKFTAKLAVIAATVMLLITAPGFASDPRLSRPVDSYLIENLRRTGEWSVKSFPSKIEYSCLKCDGAVHVTIEIISPYTAANHGSLLDRYLSDRRKYCATLAQLGKGRCIKTLNRRWRGVLQGFESETKLSDRKTIEIAYIYSERKFDPGLLKATISVQNGAKFKFSLIELFEFHLLKLTLLW